MAITSSNPLTESRLPVRQRFSILWLLSDCTSLGCDLTRLLRTGIVLSIWLPNGYLPTYSEHTTSRLKGRAQAWSRIPSPLCGASETLLRSGVGVPELRGRNQRAADSRPRPWFPCGRAWSGCDPIPGALGQRRVPRAMTAATRRSLYRRARGKKKPGTSKNRFHLPSERVLACLPIRKCRGCRSGSSCASLPGPAPVRHRAVAAARRPPGCDSRAVFSRFCFWSHAGWNRARPKNKRVGQSPSIDLLHHACIPFIQQVFFVLFVFWLSSVHSRGVNGVVNPRKTKNKHIKRI